MSMQCPGCNESIDNDSLHCDQCGVELRRCSQCGRLGTRARCGVDGGTMLAVKATAMPAQVGITSTQAVALPQVLSPAPDPASPGVSGPNTETTRIAPAGKLRLFNGAQGVDVRPASGALIGRGAGPHVDVFSRFSHISTRHLEVRCDDSGVWWAKDVGSFNHTFYNGSKLVPHKEQVLAAGATLTLADVPLTIFIE